MEPKNEPPSDAAGLRGELRRNEVKPAGAMAPYLGRRYTEEELFDEDRVWGDAAKRLVLVRAYEVPVLMGRSLTFRSAEDVKLAVAQLLAEHVPGFRWAVKDDWSGALQKYGMLHSSLSAPPDLATGEPMALELYADLVEVDGLRTGTAAFEHWQALARKALADGTTLSWDTATAVVGQATYANIAYPGVGVPFYM